MSSKDMIVQQLERIASVWDAKEKLECNLDQENERFRQEKQRFDKEIQAKAKAYQSKREGDLRGLCSEMKGLTVLLPAVPLGAASETSEYKKACDKHRVNFLKGGLADKVREKGKKALAYSRLSALGAALFVVGLLIFRKGFIDRPDWLPVLVGLLFISGIILLVRGICKGWMFRSDYNEGIRIIRERKAAADKYKKDCAERDAKLKILGSEFAKADPESIVDAIVQTVEAYNKEFLAVVVDCDAMLERTKAEYAVLWQKELEKHEEIIDKLNQLTTKSTDFLNAVNGLHPDMFCRAAELAEAIRLGRADSVKEAINIVLDDERREEEEAQRQFEAAERQALLEEQVAMERKHQDAMERNAAAQARFAEEQAIEAKRHNEEMEKAERERTKREEQRLEEQKRAAYMKCWSCANRQWCSVRRSVEASGVTCSNFVSK